MVPLFVVHYTIFDLRYNGFKSYYKFFEDEESMNRFLNKPTICKENCIIFKNIDI